MRVSVNEFLQHEMAAWVSIESGAVQQALKMGQIAVQIAGYYQVVGHIVQLNDHAATSGRSSEKLLRSFDSID
jgi:hypothetical protein